MDDRPDLEEALAQDGEIRALAARDNLQLSTWCLLEGEEGDVDVLGDAREHAERARELIESLEQEDVAAARELISIGEENLGSAD